MSRRREAPRLLIVSAACLLIGSYFGIRWQIGSRYAVRGENVGGIAVGMSQAEVEGLLGRRGDDSVPLARTVGKGETLDLEWESFAGPCEVRRTVVDWRTAEGPFVRVVFDDEGAVVSARVVRSEGEAGPGLVRWTRWWLLGF
jgi:hypothetical protein